MQRVVITTPDGEGEAIKAGQSEVWEVNIPEGGFRMYGSVAEMKKRTRRACAPDKVDFGPTTDG